jgi:hypothetical protein
VSTPDELAEYDEAMQAVRECARAIHSLASEARTTEAHSHLTDCARSLSQIATRLVRLRPALEAAS